MTRNRSGLVRGSLALVVAAALVPAGLAAASTGRVTGHHKKKPVCNLVKPTSQNTLASNNAGSTQPSTLDPSLQIISADVATKGNNLTWVIRVKKLTSSYGSGTPTGRSYEFRFVVNGVSVHPNASESQFGSSADGTMSHSKATFDTTHNEIRETVPFGDIANQYGVTIRNGQTTLSNLQATASQAIYVPNYAPGVGADGAIPFASYEQVGPVATTYLAGTPSCVKVGS